MIIDTVTPPKQPGENLPISVDFTLNMPTAGTISSCVCTSRNASTDVDTTATIVNSTATISGAVCTQFVHAGTTGDTHIVTFLATMSDGRVIEDEVILPIVEF